MTSVKGRSLSVGLLAASQLPGTRQDHRQMCEGFWERSELMPCFGDLMNDDSKDRVLESLSFREMLRVANDRVWLELTTTGYDTCKKTSSVLPSAVWVQVGDASDRQKTRYTTKG